MQSEGTQRLICLAGWMIHYRNRYFLVFQKSILTRENIISFRLKRAHELSFILRFKQSMNCFEIEMRILSLGGKSCLRFLMSEHIPRCLLNSYIETNY